MPAHFTPELFVFLSQLKRNNTAEWFQKNKPRFDELAKSPMLAFIADLRPRMAAISPHIRVEPKPVGGSMLRMNRDTRFSKDKSPYKTSIGARFMLAGAGDAMLGYYLSLEPGNCRAYAGIWEPEAATLAAIRARIQSQPKAWSAATGPAFRKRFEFDGESLKRPPQGVAPDHPHIDDLKRKSFAAYAPLDEKLVASPRFLDTFVRTCEEGEPLMRFICEAVGLKF